MRLSWVDVLAMAAVASGLLYLVTETWRIVAFVIWGLVVLVLYYHEQG